MVEMSKAHVEEDAANETSPVKGRLISFMNDLFDQEKILDTEHVLIGRDRLCDVTLKSKVVSRHHALVINSALGVKVLDLGSKNGTFVNGRRIKKCTLLNNDKITIGDCRVEFVAGDDQQSWIFAEEPTATLESQVFEPGQAGNGHAMPSADATRTMLSPRFENAQS